VIKIFDRTKPTLTSLRFLFISAGKNDKIAEAYANMVTSIYRRQTAFAEKEITLV
jgi:hypothetical protein